MADWVFPLIGLIATICLWCLVLMQRRMNYHLGQLYAQARRNEEEVERLHRDLIAARLLNGVVVPPDFSDEGEGSR